jgi:hypothetical protein
MPVHMTYGPGGSGSSDTKRGPSHNLWGDCPVKPWDNRDPGLGFGFFDDFLDFGLPGTQTSEINLNRYKVYNTGSGTVKTNSFPNGTPAYAGGVVSMLCDTDGDQSVIGTHACPFSLASSAGKLWLEARIAVTSIATATTHFFLGLGNNSDVTFGAAIPLANADATGTAVALLGWNRLEDGLGVLNTSYTDEAAAYTNVLASAGSIAADTFTKVGLLFDPQNSSRAVRFFQDGVESPTAMTAATLSALTHLDNSNMGLVFAAFADSGGTAVYHYIDWWACAQLRTS